MTVTVIYRSRVALNARITSSAFIQQTVTSLGHNYVTTAQRRTFFPLRCSLRLIHKI